jgi:lysophospholipid acyltransferase 1/2
MCKKIVIIIILALIHLCLGKFFPVSFNISPILISQPMWKRFIYLQVSVTCTRFKYYLAWALADAANIGSGLGFDGFDEFGNAKWDLCKNTDIIKLETSTSVKHFIDNWNIQSSIWLRRLAYVRLPRFKTLGVFLLSALWHGLFPGYYLTFVFLGFIVLSGRKIRHNIRPIFQRNSLTKAVYSIISWLFTMFTINYSAVPFVLLDFYPSIDFFK